MPHIFLLDEYESVGDWTEGQWMDHVDTGSLT